MLKSFFDFGKAEFFYSNLEEYFKKEFRKKFGINVIQTLYEEGNIENNIRLWLDFSNSSDNQELQLCNFVKSNMVGNSLDEMKSGEDLQLLAKKMTDLFLNCMSIKVKNGKNVHIYIYDFLIEAKNYIYGNALATIRLRMKKTYEFTNVFVFGEPLVKIVCKDLKQKSSLQGNLEHIVNICYESMRKFDNYNILQKKDVAVIILCETEIDPQRLNDYFMKK